MANNCIHGFNLSFKVFCIVFYNKTIAIEKSKIYFALCILAIKCRHACCHQKLQIKKKTKSASFSSLK